MDIESNVDDCLKKYKACLAKAHTPLEKAQCFFELLRCQLKTADEVLRDVADERHDHEAEEEFGQAERLGRRLQYRHEGVRDGGGQRREPRPIESTPSVRRPGRGAALDTFA